jgi:YbbR domain-containing protein
MQHKKSFFQIIKKALLRSNVKVFLLCFIAAVLFWIYNDLRNIRSFIIEYPIEFIYDELSLTTVQNLPKKIKIEIKGTGWQILGKMWNIQKKPIQYPLSTTPLPNYILNENLRRQVNLHLKDVELIDVITDSIKVDIDKKVKKIVEVKIDSSSISIQKGYLISRPIIIEPKRIALTGPEKIMKNISPFLYININEKNIKASFKKTIQLKVPQDTLNIIQKDEEKVNVSIFIEKDKNIK